MPLVGLIGLIGFAGLAGIRNPVATERPGTAIRLLAVFGLAGLAGFWIDGAGAIGALGALRLWNHQALKLARWGQSGWPGLAGLPFFLTHMI